MRIVPIALLIAGITVPQAVFAQSTAPAPATAPPSAAAPDRSGPPQDPEAKARWEKLQATCGADLKTHCGTIARGTEQSRSEMRQCIETHKAKFSNSCQSALAERDAARAARKQGQEKPKS